MRTRRPWINSNSVRASVRRASPKSTIFTFPSGATMTLDGLMSPWVAPLASTRLSASITSSTIRRNASHDANRILLSGCPRTTSITMKPSREAGAEDLDRHAASKLLVDAFEHHPHPAGAEQPTEPIATDPRAVDPGLAPAHPLPGP